jgi:hypothetical protein
MRRSFASTFCTACLIVLFAACGPTGSGGSGGNSGGSSGSGSGGSGGMYSGGSSGNGSGGSGGAGGIDNTPDAMNCGVQTFTPTQGLPPDLMIVLDKSGSMMDPPGSGGASKWVQVTGALNMTVGQLQSSIKFGLSFFPTDGACGVGNTAVPIMPNAGAAIASAIAGQSPGGSTPTPDGIYRGAMSLMAVGDQNPKYILLATDGDPNCSATLGPGAGGACMCPSGTTQMGNQCCILPNVCVPCTGNAVADTVAAITNSAQAGVHTFVIGVATDSSSDGNLNMMAMAGGEQRPGGPPYYYLVTNQQDLVNVINSIAGQIISCNLQLPMRPPYPDQVTVTANGQTVPRDTTHMNGWDFGPGDTSIQFYGSYCSMLQSGGISNVQAIYGCPPIGIHR